ncbi:MAG TPA: CBS domain-containing protein [Euzebyales bacterium]|nr:CBS domain-containing protein [Euzebyales bacterium]
MEKQNTIARSLHDLGLAAWFGGSLMGAIGVNGASQVVDDPTDRARVANTAWAKWTPVNAAAIGSHLIGSVPLTWSNKARLAAQPQARWVNAAKGAMTLAALATTAYARYAGQQVMDAERQATRMPVEDADGMPVQDATTPEWRTPEEPASAQGQLSALQWAVPALTGGLLILNAKAGEQQRPAAVLAQAWRARVGDLPISDVLDRVPQGGLPALFAAIATFGVGRRLFGAKARRRRRAKRGKLRARDIMTPSPTYAREDETLVEVARKLESSDIGSMPICTDDNRLTGMVTDRDIVVSVVSSGRDPRTTTVGELAGGKPVTIEADDSVSDAIRTMKRHKVRRLPVIDGDALVGIVSQADVAASVRDEQVGDLVEAISA